MTPNGASKVGRYLFEKLREVLIKGEQAGAGKQNQQVGLSGNHVNRRYMVKEERHDNTLYEEVIGRIEE